MATKRKNIQYINRDFNELRASLVDYAKTYFPTTYNDFTPASPGMMFMEMAAYVGDVLSFYLDNQVQETYLQYARQSNNIFELAYMFNYTPKVTGVASSVLSVYQLLPSKLSGSTYIPDFDYSLKINTKDGTYVKTLELESKLHIFYSKNCKILRKSISGTYIINTFMIRI